ncbi:hypothetical protein M0802_009441 [Mischocyttarus mexicanus]|nr:hypothetical protein M0802_009441 [Mischocyttarus mexicanus]
MKRRAAGKQQASRQASKQASKQAGKQASRQASKQARQAGKTSRQGKQASKAQLYSRWGGDTDRACHRPQFQSNLRHDRVSWSLVRLPLRKLTGRVRVSLTETAARVPIRQPTARA